MAQADPDHSTFDPKHDSHFALSDDSASRLLEVREALACIAQLTTAGTNANEPEVSRENLASLFRLLARNAGAAIEEGRYVVN